MKRPNFISKDTTTKKTLKAGLKYVNEKQPKRFYFPENQRSFLS